MESSAHERPSRILDDGAVMPHDDQLRCDACSEPIDGEPAGVGVYLWARGDDVRSEDAPLCAACATAIGMTALGVDEDDGEDE